jgi:hypothetical protein
MNPDPQLKAKLLVWWIIWGAILGGLVVLYAVYGYGRPLPKPDGRDLFLNLAAVVPLFVSIVIRWLVLPRFTGLTRALPLFIVGIALAEGCGILGLFLGGPYRDALWFMGFLGVAQYVPLFARRLAEPKPQGFVPNN